MHDWIPLLWCDLHQTNSNLASDIPTTSVSRFPPTLRGPWLNRTSIDTLEYQPLVGSFRSRSWLTILSDSKQRGGITGHGTSQEPWNMLRCTIKTLATGRSNYSGAVFFEMPLHILRLRYHVIVTNSRSVGPSFFTSSVYRLASLTPLPRTEILFNYSFTSSFSDQSYILRSLKAIWFWQW